MTIDNSNNFHIIFYSNLASNSLKQTFLTNKQTILSYVNIVLCSKILNNNFQHNSIYQYLTKTSKFSLMQLCRKIW